MTDGRARTHTFLAGTFGDKDHLVFVALVLAATLSAGLIMRQHSPRPIPRAGGAGERSVLRPRPPSAAHPGGEAQHGGRTTPE